MEAYKKSVNIRGTAVNTPSLGLINVAVLVAFYDSWDTSGAIPSAQRRLFKTTVPPPTRLVVLMCARSRFARACMTAFTLTGSVKLGGSQIPPLGVPYRGLTIFTVTLSFHTRLRGSSFLFSSLFSPHGHARAVAPHFSLAFSPRWTPTPH
jgi:hypothetical protein